MRAGIVVAAVVMGSSLVGCNMSDVNKVREAFGAKAETSEEGKTLGDVTSETAGDAKDGIDEKIEELEEEEVEAEASDG